MKKIRWIVPFLILINIPIAMRHFLGHHSFKTSEWWCFPLLIVMFILLGLSTCWAMGIWDGEDND